MNIYILVILTYLSAISHKEPKFLLPIFPPIFLIIGFSLANFFQKKEKSKNMFSRNCMIKFYIIFGVVLEILINAFFVNIHEIGAFEPMEYLKLNYPLYESLITT